MMMQFGRKGRRFAAALATALLIGCAAPGARSAAAAPDAAAWFKYGPDLEQNWQFAAVPGDPLQVQIRRKAENPGAKPSRILVLYPRASSAYDIAITKIIRVFEEKELNAAFTVVNYNNNDALGEQALRRIDEEKYSLVLSMGSESTAWLWRRYHGGAVPVISVCSKDPVELGQMKDYESGSGTNFAFTSLNIPIDVQFAYLLSLRPNLKNLGILVDSKNVSAMQTQADPLQKVAEARGIQVLKLAVKDPTNAAAELAPLVHNAVKTMQKSDADLSKSLFWITGSTSVFKEIHTINENSDRVPVLSVVPEVVKPGDDSAVLSVGISFESNAHLSAIYAADVLRGNAKVEALKVGIVSPADIAINFRKAREIGMRIPFTFFESASYIYDYDGQTVRSAAASMPAAN
jgi:putative tryptophan/tyrosine transport system substrate-binding protein